MQVSPEENAITLNSEQLEMEISHILEKINNFTQMVNNFNTERTRTNPKILFGYILYYMMHHFWNNLLEYMQPIIIILKVSELLESGKSMLKELINEFEERMIL